MGKKIFQFGRQWTQQFNAFSADWMIKLQAPSMQKHPLQGRRASHPLQRLVQFKIAVLVIAQNRMAFAGDMDTDLVRAPGLQGDFE